MKSQFRDPRFQNFPDPGPSKPTPAKLRFGYATGYSCTIIATKSRSYCLKKNIAEVNKLKFYKISLQTRTFAKHRRLIFFVLPFFLYFPPPPSENSLKKALKYKVVHW
jgi:hypothetical protein